ncbi:MAG: hypothetical protein J1E81_03735 [Eubacterium sp.]|nr:hypothetical protein [Eubacterium sp.]
MAEFNESDIEAAKRRVREMRNRANRYMSDMPERESNDKNNSTSGQSSEASNLSDSSAREGQTASDDKLQDKSFLIILALIFILSNEGADNKLILALLYLLL